MSELKEATYHIKQKRESGELSLFGRMKMDGTGFMKGVYLLACTS